MAHPALAQLEACLATLAPTALDVQDDSHHHAGHAGAREGGHFRVTIVSEAFRNKNRVARHKLVHEAVGHLMHNGIHALSIAAYTPDEAAARST